MQRTTCKQELQQHKGKKSLFLTFNTNDSNHSIMPGLYNWQFGTMDVFSNSAACQQFSFSTNGVMSPSDEYALLNTHEKPRHATDAKIQAESLDTDIGKTN
jgi:hypothetical protein